MGVFVHLQDSRISCGRGETTAFWASQRGTPILNIDTIYSTVIGIISARPSSLFIYTLGRSAQRNTLPRRPHPVPGPEPRSNTKDVKGNQTGERAGGGRRGTAGHGRRWPGTVGDGRGRLGTARVMSHDVKRIRLEVYDFSLVSTCGPSAGTIVPYSASSPHLAGRSPS